MASLSSAWMPDALWELVHLMKSTTKVTKVRDWGGVINCLTLARFQQGYTSDKAIADLADITGSLCWIN